MLQFCHILWESGIFTASMPFFFFFLKAALFAAWCFDLIRFEIFSASPPRALNTYLAVAKFFDLVLVPGGCLNLSVITIWVSFGLSQRLLNMKRCLNWGGIPCKVVSQGILGNVVLPKKTSILPQIPPCAFWNIFFVFLTRQWDWKITRGEGVVATLNLLRYAKGCLHVNFFLERIWIPLENGSKALTFMQNAGCPCSHNAHWTFANWNNEQWHKKFWAERYWGSNVITRIVVIVMCSLDLFFWLGWMFYKCWICHTRNMKYAFFFKERKNQILDQIKKNN